MHAINNFNTEISRSSSDGYPLLNSEESDLPENLQFIHQLYLKSDLVANKYQSTLRRYTILFYALTTGLLVTLVMYFKLFPLSIVIGLYLVLYIVTMLVSAKIRNSDYQKK